MNESKLEKKYDFFEYSSELIIPKETFEDSSSKIDPLKDTNIIPIEPENLYYNNNLIIENSTFIIKSPDKKKILLILSIDKDLPSKIEKNAYPISFNFPVLQAISFMHDSKNESILVSSGYENLVDKIEVFQIQIKQLMHEAIFNLLKYIKNAVKIIPIKNDFALVLHLSTEKYKKGGLKLWKNFHEEIYNFNVVYNFAFNFQNNKIICLDNESAPFAFSIYTFDESFFNKKEHNILQPEFFIQLEEFLHVNKEEDIEKFLNFESFNNIIIFWAKKKKDKSDFLLSIVFINFKENKCLKCIEFNFEGKNKYFFKINKNTKEIYIFNLSEEILFIYSFKTINTNPRGNLSPDNLFISKSKFNGNIKGVDFTSNNGMVVLTEQYNLVCYSRNEILIRDFQKKYVEEKSQNDSDLGNNEVEANIFSKDNNFNLGLKKYRSMKNLRTKENEENIDVINKKSNSEENKKIIKRDLNQKDINDIINKKINDERKKKIKEELEKQKELINKQNEILEKLKLKCKENNIITNLSNSFQNKLSKFEQTILSDISQMKLEEMYNKNQYHFNNYQENKNKYDIFDINLLKAKNFIYEIQSNIPEIVNTKNKLIKFLKNEIEMKKIKKKMEENNCDFESLKLFNKSIELKGHFKNEIEKILYNNNLFDKKTIIIARINGIINCLEKKMNLLLLKCKNDIIQINEIYKYNKIMMSKNQERDFINVLTNPFIQLLANEINDLKEKMNDFLKDNGEENENNNENKLINKFDLIKDKTNFEKQLSFCLEDTFEKNNYFSFSEIIKNHYINLDDDFS